MLIKIGVGGVDISPLHPKIWDALRVVHGLWGGEEVVITSTWEGNHIPHSKHYQMKAVDIRRPKVEAGNKIRALQMRLQKEYDVLNEVDHVHIEYDPK